MAHFTSFSPIRDPRLRSAADNREAASPVTADRRKRIRLQNPEEFDTSERASGALSLSPQSSASSSSHGAKVLTITERYIGEISSLKDYQHQQEVARNLHGLMQAKLAAGQAPNQTEIHEYTLLQARLYSYVSNHRKTKIEKLQSKLDALKSQKAGQERSYEEVIRNKDSLTSQLEQARIQKELLSSQLIEAQSALQNYARDEEQYKTKISELEESVRNLEGTNRELNERIETLNADVASFVLLQSAWKEQTVHQDRQIKRLEDNLLHLRKELETTKGLLAGEQRESAQLKNHNLQLIQTIEDLRKTIHKGEKTHQKDLQQQQKQAQEIAQNAATIQTLQTQLRDVTGRLTQSEKANREKTEKLGQLAEELMRVAKS